MRVSITIPTVNRLALLREAISSVADQTYRDFEVIIGDNSAERAYAAAVDALVDEYPALPIKVHHHATNLGMIGNCNFLVDAASGEYWTYLPDDDRLCPNALERMVSTLSEQPGAGLVFSDHWIMDAEGRVDVERTEANSTFYGRTQLRAGFYPKEELFLLAVRQVFELQSMMFRREVIRELRFSPESGPVVDYDMQLRLWQSTSIGGAVYLPERLTEYRIHGAQFTGSGRERESHEAVIRALEHNSPPDARTSPVYREKLARHYAALAALSAKDGRRSEAFLYGLRAARLDPMHPKALASPLYSVTPGAVLDSLQGLRRLTRASIWSRLA